jgi:uncharacterized protein
MTPDERNLIADLFDRLATLEDSPRDPDAERVIKEGLRQAPNAAYALVQTALVQDEALKRADARIQELEATLGMNNEPARPAGFLDNMRNALFGRQEPPPRPGSVPSVPMGGPDGYRSGMAPGYGQMGPGPGQMGPGPGQMGPVPGMEPGRPGGSFLGTAAAAAAGAIGGSMMLDGIRSMMGHQRPGGSREGGGGAAQAASSPWSSGSSSGGGGGDLARQAGVDDIGHSPSGGGRDGDAGRGYGLLNSNDDLANDELADDDLQDMDDGDFGDDAGPGGNDD